MHSKTVKEEKTTWATHLPKNCLQNWVAEAHCGCEPEHMLEFSENTHTCLLLVASTLNWRQQSRLCWNWWHLQLIATYDHNRQAAPRLVILSIAAGIHQRLKRALGGLR